MNETKIVSIDVLIDRIKKCGYIDTNEDDYYNEYEYDNILYYLEKYKDLQSKTDKANNKIEDIKMMTEFDNCKANAILNEVQEILEEDK